MTDEKKVAPDKSDTLNDPKNDQKKNDQKKETGFNTTSTVGKPIGAKADPAKTKPKATNWSLRILGVILIFIFGALTSIYYMPALKQRLPFVARWVGENGNSDISLIQQHLNEQKIEIEALKTRTNDLETKLSQLPEGSETSTNEISSGLDLRLSELEQKLNSLPMQPENKAAPIQDTSQSARIDMLLSRMSQLEASFVPLSQNMVDAARAEKERQSLLLQNKSLEEKTADLEKRLLAVEKIASKDNSGLLLNLRIADLKRRIIAGEAFVTELDAIRELASRNSLMSEQSFKQSFDILIENAPGGVKTPEQLRLSFNDLIPEILNTGGIDEQASWWQNTLTRIKNLITVRKTDGTSYDEKGLDVAINETETWLAGSSVKKALEAVEKMPYGSQVILEPWKQDAQNWVAVDNAVNMLATKAEDNYLNKGSASNPVLNSGSLQ
ncbi:MAG: hypothetical protein KDF58_03075 [Alphaproteobacteria bacterium]|nr:hypothetical protein [Alphaproteobacteria bacterium]HPF46053.1 hypothetical protein [Emcibacteraceae bacterium]